MGPPSLRGAAWACPRGYLGRDAGASLLFCKLRTVFHSPLAMASRIWSSTPTVPPGRGPCDGSGRGVRGPDSAFQCGLRTSSASRAALTASPSISPSAPRNSSARRASTASCGSASSPVAAALMCEATARCVALAARCSAASTRSASFSASVFWASSNAFNLAPCSLASFSAAFARCFQSASAFSPAGPSGGSTTGSRSPAGAGSTGCTGGTTGSGSVLMGAPVAGGGTVGVAPGSVEVAVAAQQRQRESPVLARVGENLANGQARALHAGRAHHLPGQTAAGDALGGGLDGPAEQFALGQAAVGVDDLEQVGPVADRLGIGCAEPGVLLLARQVVEERVRVGPQVGRVLGGRNAGALAPRMALEPGVRVVPLAGQDNAAATRGPGDHADVAVDGWCRAHLCGQRIAPGIGGFGGDQHLQQAAAAGQCIGGAHPRGDGLLGVDDRQVQ